MTSQRRDKFIRAALTGLLATLVCSDDDVRTAEFEWIAQRAVKLADATIAEADKHEHRAERNVL